jgi:hypothetical protein
MWEALGAEMDAYEASVVRELVRTGDKRDDEKRAILFAIQVIRNFPSRIIEAGILARRARHEAEERKRLAQLETIGQAVETLGPTILTGYED